MGWIKKQRTTCGWRISNSKTWQVIHLLKKKELSLPWVAVKVPVLTGLDGRLDGDRVANDTYDRSL